MLEQNLNRDMDQLLEQNGTAEGEVVPTQVNETAIIAENTRILGNIKTKGNIAIVGSVEGDVHAAGNVVVSGNVRGNVTASNISVEKGQLIANFKALEQIVVKEQVVLNGDIECETATIMGSINGDLDCAGKLILMSTARVTGSVRCAELGTEIGSKINGTIIMK